MRRLLFLAFSLFATPVLAEPALTGGPEYTVTTSLGSHHFGERSPGRDYNEFNPGIGLEAYQTPFAQWGDWTPRTFLAGGYYHNSIDKPTFYATGGVEACHPFSGGQWAFCPGIQAGAVTGYVWTVTPAAIGYMKLQREDIFAKLGVIPPVPGDDQVDDVPTTLILQLGYRFN